MLSFLISQMLKWQRVPRKFSSLFISRLWSSYMSTIHNGDILTASTPSQISQTASGPSGQNPCRAISLSYIGSVCGGATPHLSEEGVSQPKCFSSCLALYLSPLFRPSSLCEALCLGEKILKA